METIKTLLTRIVITLTFFALTTVSVYAESQDKSGQDVTKVQVKELLSEIQKTLIIVQNDAASKNLPELESVTLNLSAELIKGAGGAINLFIVSIGADVSKESVQSITMKLTPPKAGKGKEKGKISEPLANAILSAAAGAASAKEMLELSELKASIKFAVEVTGDGGIKFTLLPITGEIKGKVSEKTTQEIIIFYKVKEKAKK